MSSSVPFRLPASFVLERALPTSAELAYGYCRGWLGPTDVVTIAVAKLEHGAPVAAAEQELALLLADDLERVDELAADLGVTDQPTEDRALFWLYLALAWLWEHRAEVEDPLTMIELLYAEFDYPEGISGLVRYMPAQPGGSTGKVAIEHRWRSYLERQASAYAARNAAWGR